MSLGICIVSSAYRPYPSGVSEHAHHLAVALRDRGHAVDILTGSYPGSGPGTPGITRLGRTLILPANRSRFTLPIGVRLPAQVRRYFSGRRFDIVHCHGIFPPELAYWATIHTRAPVVVTFHTSGLQLPGFIPAGFRRLFAGLRGRVRARIAVSEAGRRWAEAWFPGKYHVIPNGVDLNRFHPGAMLPPEAASLQPYLLFVGRLEQRKGLEVLLRAMPAILVRVPRIRLVVVGSGPLETSCRRLASRLDIAGRVHFLGGIDGDDLPGWYAGAELYVSPALSGEAMGIVLIEAMASGVPVVAADIAGYDEVVTTGLDGLLVPPGNPGALAAAVGELLADPDRRSRLAGAGRERARHYAWPRVAQQVEAVYREVLD
jgi:phosphatidylinositol alpha-mannosyltransferase